MNNHNERAKMNLSEQYAEMAKICYFAGMNCDDRPDGQIHRWVMANVKHRPETAFFIVLGINCELAKLTAEPQAPKFCKGQMRLFEPHSQFGGRNFARNPNYGKATD